MAGRMHIVLLSGGSGTRLWPLSNDARSKQFLKVLRDTEGKPVSMVQRTYSMIEDCLLDADVTIATCEQQKASIQAQINGEYQLVLEPERRDTAPAIMLACMHLLTEQKADPKDTVIVMPIDAFAERAFYGKLKELDCAVRAGTQDLVLLGVEPAYASTKYGYIVPANREGDVWPVKCFAEKPDTARAQELISLGALWNCGVFAFRLEYLADIVHGYVSEASFDILKSNYSLLPKRSFDYEVVEKADSIAVIPFTGVWKDLGTWDALTEEMAEVSSGRAHIDAATSSNIHVINETGLPMVVAGLHDAVVVATPDGILVSDKETSANIKSLVADAAAARPMYEQRLWGEYRVLDSSVYPDGARAITKELVIKPGAQISYQRHNHRSEVWTIVSGAGEVVLDGQVLSVKVGSVIDIAPGVMHGVHALSELHLIEVQLGHPLIEEDIIREGFFWDE